MSLAEIISNNQPLPILYHDEKSPVNEEAIERIADCLVYALFTENEDGLRAIAFAFDRAMDFFRQP